MGTRCGDLDPAVVLYIQNATGRGPKEMDKLFNKESGLLGMAGKSDVRAILEESAQGNERANLAMNVSHPPEHLAKKLVVGASTCRSVDSKQACCFQARCMLAFSDVQSCASNKLVILPDMFELLSCKASKLTKLQS